VAGPIEELAHEDLTLSKEFDWAHKLSSVISCGKLFISSTSGHTTGISIQRPRVSNKLWLVFKPFEGIHKVFLLSGFVAGVFQVCFTLVAGWFLL
jgi:hypothetical protein